MQNTTYYNEIFLPFTKKIASINLKIVSGNEQYLTKADWELYEKIQNYFPDNNDKGTKDKEVLSVDTSHANEYIEFNSKNLYNSHILEKVNIQDNFYDNKKDSDPYSFVTNDIDEELFNEFVNDMFDKNLKKLQKIKQYKCFSI